MTAAGNEGHPNEMRAFYNAGKEEGYVWLFLRYGDNQIVFVITIVHTRAFVALFPLFPRQA